jgi:hypothetical protein
MWWRRLTPRLATIRQWRERIGQELPRTSSNHCPLERVWPIITPSIQGTLKIDAIARRLISAPRVPAEKGDSRMIRIQMLRKACPPSRRDGIKAHVSLQFRSLPRVSRLFRKSTVIEAGRFGAAICLVGRTDRQFYRAAARASGESWKERVAR